MIAQTVVTEDARRIKDLKFAKYVKEWQEMQLIANEPVADT